MLETQREESSITSAHLLLKNLSSLTKNQFLFNEIGHFHKCFLCVPFYTNVCDLGKTLGREFSFPQDVKNAHVEPTFTINARFHLVATETIVAPMYAFKSTRADRSNDTYASLTLSCINQLQNALNAVIRKFKCFKYCDQDR